MKTEQTNMAFAQAKKPVMAAKEINTQRTYQQHVCRRLVQCANELGYNVTKTKGQKLVNFYIENIRGACIALEMLGTDAKRHEQLNGLLIVMTLVCTRGAEVVHAIAEGKDIP